MCSSDKNKNRDQDLAEWIFLEKFDYCDISFSAYKK